MIFLEQDVILTVSSEIDCSLMLVVNQLLTGEGFDLHCHSNLTRAILPYHLTEFDVHDVLNVVCNLLSFPSDGSFNVLD
jgi:uncharacterized protein YcgI (DUF1989 family)